MTGPKHLWSGNWEDEPPSGQDELFERPVPARDPDPSPPPAPPKAAEPALATPYSPPPRHRATTPAPPKRRIPVWIALGAVALVVAAVLIATSIGGSSTPTTAANPPTAPAPALAATTPTTQTTPAATSPPVEWLGMELVTVQPGVATVETVRLGGEGDRAGLSPGDVILAVNGHTVDGAEGIAKAISGLHAGDKAALQISHGSSLYNTEATLGAPPTRYP